MCFNLKIIVETNGRSSALKWKHPTGTFCDKFIEESYLSKQIFRDIENTHPSGTFCDKVKLFVYDKYNDFFKGEYIYHDDIDKQVCIMDQC